MKDRKLVCEAVDEGNEVAFPAIHRYLIPKHYCTSEEVGTKGETVVYWKFILIALVSEVLARGIARCLTDKTMPVKLP